MSSLTEACAMLIKNASYRCQVKSEITNLNLLPKHGPSFFSVGTGFNYFHFHAVVDLNRYETSLFDPDHSNSIIQPFLRFPKPGLSHLPWWQWDIYAEYTAHAKIPIIDINGSLSHDYFEIVNHPPNGPYYIYFDFGPRSYFIKPHTGHQSTGTILHNNLSIAQFDSIYGEMIGVFGYANANATILIRLSGLALHSGVEYIYILTQYFATVELIKSVESAWLMDVILIRCSNPTFSIQTLPQIKGSVENFLQRPPNDIEFLASIRRYTVFVYNAIYALSSLLIRTIKDPTKVRINQMYLDVDKFVLSQKLEKRIVRKQLRESHIINSRSDTGEIYTDFKQIQGEQKYQSDTQIGRIPFGGQIKLFLAEAEFLATVLPKLSDKSSILYIGAAPGIHIPLLVKLFESYKPKWLLFDPGHFSDTLKGLPNVILIKKYFTAETAKQLAKQRTRNLILISDIRSWSNNQISTIDIMHDWTIQNDAIRILRPTASLLKLRFPFTDDTSGFLSLPRANALNIKQFVVNQTEKSTSPYEMIFPAGEFKLQAFQGFDSAEMRLWQVGPIEWMGVTKETLQRIEDKLFYFNTKIRFTPRNVPDLIELNWPCLCNDCAIMYNVIMVCHAKILGIKQSFSEFFDYIISQFETWTH